MIHTPVQNMLVSTGFAVVRSKNKLISNEILYLCLTSNEFLEIIQQLAEQSTSTFPAVKPSDLSICLVPNPTNCDMSNLVASLKIIFKMIDNHRAENIRLAQLRDTLLPKLMSGELDVENVEV